MEMWSCLHCTFQNDDKSKRCSMCRKGRPAAEVGPSSSPRPQQLKKRRGAGQGRGKRSIALRAASSSSDADEDDTDDEECEELDKTSDLNTSADPIEVLDSSDDDTPTPYKTSPASTATSHRNARGGGGGCRKKSDTASGSAKKAKDTAGKPKGQTTKRKRVKASSQEDGGEDTDLDVERSQSVKKARGGAVVDVEDGEGDVFAFTEESPLKPSRHPKGSWKPAASAFSSSTSSSAKPKQDGGQQRKLDTFLVHQDRKAPQKTRQQTVRVVSAGYVDDDDHLLDDPTEGLTVDAVVKLANAPPTTGASPESPISRKKAPRPALSPASSTASSSVPSHISVVHALTAGDVPTSKRRKENDGQRSSSGGHGGDEERQGAEEGAEEGETSEAMLQLLLQGESVDDGSDVDLSLVQRSRYSSDAARHHHLYNTEDIIDSIEARRRNSCPAPRSSRELLINSHSPRQSPAKPHVAAAGGGQSSVRRDLSAVLGPSTAARDEEKAAAGAFAWTLEDDDGDDEDEAGAHGEPETSRRIEQGPSSATSKKATSEVSSKEDAGAHPSNLKATVRGDGASERPVEEIWSCTSCTFDNQMSNEDCEVCGKGKRPTLKSSASKTIVSGMNSVVVRPPQAMPRVTATSSPNGGQSKPGAQEARSSAGFRTAQEFLSEGGQGADSMNDIGARHAGDFSDAVDDWGKDGEGRGGFMSEQDEDGEEEIDDDIMLDEEASDSEYEASVRSKNEDAVKEPTFLDLTCTDDEIEAFSDHDDSQRLRGPNHPQLPHFRSIQRLRESGSNTVDWGLMTDGGGGATRGVTQANYNERRKRRDVKNANDNQKKKKKSGRGKSKGGWGGGWRGRRGRGGKSVNV